MYVYIYYENWRNKFIEAGTILLFVVYLFVLRVVFFVFCFVHLNEEGKKFIRLNPIQFVCVCENLLELVHVIFINFHAFVVLKWSATNK